MIVCSCNELTDHEIRNVVMAAHQRPLNARQVYDCLGCSMQCGCCARAIKQIIAEVSTAYRGGACCVAKGTGTMSLVSIDGDLSQLPVAGT
jgi:bacterioferritin-associated ferredoxin